jgi:dTDP-4-amino-4,6-dideoxygalactose transaminase
MSRILLSTPDVTELEEGYLLAALRSGWVAPLGPEVDRFEAEMAARIGVDHALALSSGSAALHLALLTIGAGPGRAVVIPTMTFAASANSAVYTGATPVFVDARTDDGNIDPELLVAGIDTLRSEGADIAAVMSVDLFGRSADYDVIRPALADREIPLVEDAAEALGARYGDAAAGSFGVAAALSFNGNKIMTTSGGGMLLSNDAGVIARCRYLSTQARQPVPYYEHTDVGYNYRLSNLLAALGRAQLVRLDDMMSRRRAIREHYADRLGDIPGISFLGRDTVRGDGADNCWLTAVVLDPLTTGFDADTLVKALDAEDIEARHLWKPMHMQPVFRDARAFVSGAAESLFRCGVTLPSGSSLSDADVSRVADAMCSILGKSR